jgi:hypothetical protein
LDLSGRGARYPTSVQRSQELLKVIRGLRGNGIIVEPNKATAEIKALAQAYGAEAIEALANALGSSDPKVSLMAANALLDRG